MTTYLEAEESLGTLLEHAAQEGSVRIQRSNGQVFVLQPDDAGKSPLDVPGVNLPLTSQQIIDLNLDPKLRFVSEDRGSSYGSWACF